MSYSILNAEQDLSGILHGTNLNNVINLFSVFNRAARQVLLDVDPSETIRIVPIGTPLFTNVYDYPLPVDVKGNKVVDIAPQVNRTIQDIFVQSYNQQFDTTKLWTLQDSFTVQFNSSIKTIRINAPTIYPPPVPITLAEGVNVNGTWTTGGNASNISTNNINFVAGGGSVMFNLNHTGTPGSTGYIENSTLATQNLSEFLNQAVQFLYTSLPTASSFSGVELRFGSDASDYYVLSTNVTQENTIFQNGWNLLQYPWVNMTTVGSPNPSAITYCRVTWTYDGTLQTGVLLNSVVSTLGQIFNMSYYSKYLFRDAITGAYQETVTDTSNLLNLDTDSYNLFLYQTAYLLVQQQQGLSGLFFDANYFLQFYQEAVQRYKTMYKSQTQKPMATYYKQPNAGYGQWVGRSRYGY